MNPKQMREQISKQCGFTHNKAKQYPHLAIDTGNKAEVDRVWEEMTGLKPTVPESFEDWIKQGNDAIDDPGGNIIPSRVQSNHDQYDNEPHPFQ